jgi:hypothetical protein
MKLQVERFWMEDLSELALKKKEAHSVFSFQYPVEIQYL